MGYTTAQLTALESAIALGVLTVHHSDGTSKTYRSLKEMQEIRRQMRQELGVQAPTYGRKFAQFNDGLIPREGIGYY